ncbi:hypothetical protein [Chitinophaga sp. sic0106]|uniref:hypothetical protein n=1 Tax=Chitinophaga sp. sic0106 TaxID=2854785 RepID=UPI001C43BDEB|nr:hypothetical protein [Chitinophaga sp. sic0106]MBV7532474.1 hypothetical protein [Chitinophaga sp. sic0106]
MKTKLIYGILSFLFLLVNSCTDYDSSTPTEKEKVAPQALIDAAKTWYATQIKLKDTADEKQSNYKLKIRWESSIMYPQNNGTHLLIAPTADFKLNNDKYGFLRKAIFVEKEGEIISGNIVEAYGDPKVLSSKNNSLFEQINSSTIPKFNGAIIVYDITYFRLEGRYYKEGIVQGNSKLTSGDTYQNTLSGKHTTPSLSTESEQDCRYVFLVTYWSDGTQTWDFLYSYCIDTGSNPGGGGGNTTENALSRNFNVNSVYGGNGNKPIAEYPITCSGVQGSWDRAATLDKEVVSVLTVDNRVMTVAVLGYDGGRASGFYMHEGQAYYTYPESQGAPQQQYAGMIKAAGQYFIPIRATIHTHSPCIQDGTDGVSNQTLSNGDQNMATSYPSIVHYIIGCGAIGQFKAGETSATVIATGPLNVTCSSIK